MMVMEYRTVSDEGSRSFQHTTTANQVTSLAQYGWKFCGAIQMLHLPNETYGYITLATLEREKVAL